MRSQYMNIPVTQFLISGDDETVHEADDPASFEQTDDLLNRLREENPNVTYSLLAEIDA